MTDIFLPPWVNVAALGFSPIEFVGVSQSPFGGFPRTATLASGRMRASMEFTAAGGASTQVERGRLISLLVQGGKQNRWILYNPEHRLRGSFPSFELLSNNTFASGTTGFSNGGTASVLSVADRVMRITRTSSAFNNQVSQAVSTSVPFAPYVARAMLVAGRGSVALRVFAQNGAITSQSGNTLGLASTVIIPVSPTITALAYDAAASGGVAGDYFEVPYISLARCALVDGGVNLIPRSQEFNDASWNKSQATVSANATVAPDGTSTADDLVDNAVNAQHFVSNAGVVPSGSLDVQFTVAILPRARGFAGLSIQDGVNGVFVLVNLSTGTTTSTGVGTNWSDLRVFSQSLGGGWYRFSVVARKPSAATTLFPVIYSSNDGVSFSYTGNSTAAISMWGATMSVSGVPARQKQTGSVASPNSETQGGNTLHLKGLPASTSGLLLPGDCVEVIGARGGEMKIVTAALNSDATGLGHLQIAPAMRFSPSDNAAVIIHQPMGRFILESDAPAWSTSPGLITTSSAEFIEA